MKVVYWNMGNLQSFYNILYLFDEKKKTLCRFFFLLIKQIKLERRKEKKGRDRMCPQEL